MGTVLFTRNPAGRAPGVPLRLACLFDRSAALTHLARHARADALPGHLRTCQCRTRGCRWHPRHRGCAGPVLLALTCDRSGRPWRLADACAACAAAMSRTAVVPPTLLGTGHTQPTASTSRPARTAPAFGPAEQQRVREMLTYLATALPRFSSPAARLLALQCALRADHHGQIRLPHGFLRGMRLHGRAELWLELEHAGWLYRPSRRCSPVQAQLLDAAVLHQAPGRTARVRRPMGPAPHPAGPSVRPALRSAADRTRPGRPQRFRGGRGASSTSSPASADSRPSSWRTSSTNWSAPAS